MNSRLSFGLCIFLLFFSQELLAFPQTQGLSGNHAHINNYVRVADEINASAENQYLSLSKPFVLTGRINGIGATRIRLTHQRRFNVEGEKTDLMLFQGTAKIRSRHGKRTAPVAASARTTKNGDLRVRVGFISLPPNRRRTATSIRHATYRLNLSPGQNRFTVIERSRLRVLHQPQGVCGTYAESEGDLGVVTEELSSSALFTQMTVIMEGDNELAGRVNNLHNTLSWMMNWVDTVYRRDLKLTFDATIVSQAQNYQEPVAYDENTFTYYLHDEMRDRRPPAARSQDIHYLVTGKVPEANSEGLGGVVPDLGTVCQSKANSLGLTVFYDDWLEGNASTTAHEIGHLLDARHDDNVTGDTGFIMNSGTNNVDQYVEEFSSLSKTQVAAYVQQNGFCMQEVEKDEPGDDDQSGDPEFSDPGDGQLELRLRRRIGINKRGRTVRRLVARSLEFGSPSGFIPVSISCGDDAAGPFYQTLKSEFTNRRGRMGVRYRPRRVPPYCVSHTEGFSTLSNPIKVRRGRF